MRPALIVNNILRRVAMGSRMVHYLLNTASLRSRRINGLGKSAENGREEGEGGGRRGRERALSPPPSLSFSRFSQPLPLCLLRRLRYRQKKIDTSIDTIIRETTVCTACVWACTVEPSLPFIMLMAVLTCLCRCENQAVLYMSTCTLLTFFNYPWAMLKKKTITTWIQ